MAKINIKNSIFDPYFNNVSLLLPFDSSFQDYSKNNFNVTVNGDTQISTAQSKFGTSSAYFDGNGDYLGCAGNPAFDFGTSDFTVEMWVNFSSLPSTNSYAGLVGTYFLAGGVQANNGQWWVGLRNVNGQLVLQLGRHGDGYIYAYANWTPSLEKWYHVAVVRSGNNILLFIDGVSQTVISSNNWENANFNSSNYFAVGMIATPVYFNGYIDDLRITKGIARYTSNFTPPKALLSNGKLNIKKITNPSNISNLSLWLKSDTGITLNGSSKVISWADQSGNSRNFVNPATIGINNTGLPSISDGAVFFTRSSRYGDINASILALPSSSLNLTTPYTLFAVVRGSTDYCVISKSMDATKRRKLQLAVYNGGFYAIEKEGTELVYTPIDNNNPAIKRLFVAQFASESFAFLRYNGSLVDTSSGPFDLDLTNTAPVYLGASPFQAGSGYNAEASLDMYIYEIILYDHILSDFQIKKIESYLNSRYTITTLPILENKKIIIKTAPPFPIDQLIAFWPLNNTNGLSTIPANFGNYTLNTYGGYTSVQGKINNGFYFNGSNQGLWTNEQILNQITDPCSFSVSYWLKVPSNSSSFTLMGNAFGSLGFHFDYYNLGNPYYPNGEYGVSFRMPTGGGYNWHVAFSMEEIATNTWVHIVGTYSLPAATMKIYINGTLKGTKTSATYGTGPQPGWHGFAINGSVLIGGKEYGATQSFDAIGFWKKELNLSEILQLYNNGNGLEY